MFRLTPIVRNLIIINAIVFVVQQIIPLVTEYLALWNINTPYFKPYQLFTYMFSHGGFMHIFFNMLTLAFLGPILESFWGQNKFVIFYLVAGVGAAVFSVLIDLLTHAPGGIMVGASGAIYGLLAAFGMIFPNMEVRLLIPPVPIKAKYLIFLMGGLTFMMDKSGSVAHFAHLGGALVGFIVVMAWGHQNKGGYF